MAAGAVTLLPRMNWALAALAQLSTAERQALLGIFGAGPTIDLSAGWCCDCDFYQSGECDGVFGAEAVPFFDPADTFNELGAWVRAASLGHRKRLMVLLWESLPWLSRVRFLDRVDRDGIFRRAT